MDYLVVIEFFLIKFKQEINEFLLFFMMQKICVCNVSHICSIISLYMMCNILFNMLTCILPCLCYDVNSGSYIWCATYYNVHRHEESCMRAYAACGNLTKKTRKFPPTLTHFKIIPIF